MISSSFNAKSVLLKLAALKVVFQESNMDDPGVKVGEELLRLSQREVPHDEGNLQNSGTVDKHNGQVVVGYHQPYAARLHEHPEYKFQKGRKGKYLEDPLRLNAKALGLKYSKGVEKKIRKVT